MGQRTGKGMWTRGGIHFNVVVKDAKGNAVRESKSGSVICCVCCKDTPIGPVGGLGCNVNAGWDWKIKR